MEMKDVIRSAPNLSGYEWDLLEYRGDVCGLTQLEWYEVFLSFDDEYSLRRLSEFFTYPPDLVERLLDSDRDARDYDRLLLPTDQRLLQYIATDSAKILSLKPREFEAFTAQLLVKLGYVDVELGKGSKDGGVDVTAVLQHSLGVERIIVQCKQFAIENKVGEPTVKQLLAEVGLRDAARGLLITTSSFTSGARTLIAAHRYRLSSIDGNDLISILRRFPKAPVTG